MGIIINGLTDTVTAADGSLNIGGDVKDISYDDVTNIDSVGIITAQAGVKVPDNQTIFLGTGNDLQIYHNGSHSYISVFWNWRLTIGLKQNSYREERR